MAISVKPATRPVGYSEGYEIDYVMSLTLMSREGPIDFKKMHDEHYDPWYDKVRAWSEKQLHNYFLGSRAYRKNDNITIFNHIFLDRAQRDDYCDSQEYEDSKAALERSYEIMDEVMLDFAAGHGSSPGGG